MSRQAGLRGLERLNELGAEGGELVSEHVTQTSTRISIFGTLKFRHDTRNAPLTGEPQRAPRPGRA